MIKQILDSCRLGLLCTLCVFHLPLAAKEIELKLPSGIVASADYRAGEKSKPAVLILHGYLQTRNFPLVYNLADALSGAGYAVLTPTLSLGISHRSQSLACEAIHTHAMQDDVDELRRWTNWLTAQGHKSIVLIGHSFAAIQLLSYEQNHPAAEVKKLVLISLSDMEHKFLSPGRVDKKAAIELATKDKNAMVMFELGFCRQYRSTAPAYLSYVAWTQERVLKVLPGVKVPYEAIFGESDTVVSPTWPEQVRKAGAPVTIIPNANHFFDDSSAEFELLGKLDTILSATPEK